MLDDISIMLLSSYFLICSFIKKEIVNNCTCTLNAIICNFGSWSNILGILVIMEYKINVLYLIIIMFIKIVLLFSFIFLTCSCYKKN